MTNAHCRHCGYDLVGLEAAGRCPECGERFNKDTRLNTSHQGGGVDGERRDVRRLALLLVGLSLLSAGLGGGLASVAADPLPALAWGLCVAGVFLLAALWVITR